MHGRVGLPRREPAIGKRQPSHGEDAAEPDLPRLPWEFDALLHLPAGALGRAAADRQVRGVVARVTHLGFATANVAERGGDGMARRSPAACQRLADTAQLAPDLVDGAIVAEQQAAVPTLPVVDITVGVTRIDDVIEVAHQVLEVDEHRESDPRGAGA